MSSDSAQISPRLDLETRCIVCNSFRYDDINNQGIWEGDKWKCDIHSGKESLTDRTRKILKYHDDGQLVNKEEYAKLLREWIYEPDPDYEPPHHPV